MFLCTVLHAVILSMCCAQIVAPCWQSDLAVPVFYFILCYGPNN